MPTLITQIERCRRAVVLLFALLSLRAPGLTQTLTLDDFESLDGWQAVVSEGAKLELRQEHGRTGKAMVMAFDLRGVHGYAIARKALALDLPPNYQFVFDMRADAPVNNFEFKLVDDQDNIFWLKKLNVTYPVEWTKQRIKKRHLTFAWGPSRRDEIRTVRAIEFVVSAATGGTGSVLIDNLRFEPIDDEVARKAVARVTASSSAPGKAPRVDPEGSVLSAWQTIGMSDTEWLAIDFGREKEIGGLAIDWDSARYPRAYDVQLSDDGKEWRTAYSVASGAGGRRHILLQEAEGRFLRLHLARANHSGGYRFSGMQVRGPEHSSSPNAFFRSLASEARSGLYPKYLSDRQSYWTVVGVSGDRKEALVNEEGQVEVDRQQFMLEPFLFVDNLLVTWDDVSRSTSLMEGYLPIPSVTWKYRDKLTLTVQVVAGGEPDSSLLAVKYTVESNQPAGKGRLFVAIRPFQVNPPWQALNIEGGACRIDSIAYLDGLVRVSGRTLVPLTPPAGFGAVEFDGGDITEYLRRGDVPGSRTIGDHFGHGSAALAYDLSLEAGARAEVVVVVPFHAWKGDPGPGMADGNASAYFQTVLRRTAEFWRRKLNAVRLALPPAAQVVENTLKSTLAYVLINRDGPGIQPGSRSYERSWIRDGSLTCAALLRMGYTEEVRDFLDWYATGQFPSGKIPCVIDQRGPDPVPEHDSHGQFIYGVLQYFHFTHDTTWLRGKLSAVVKTVRYIQSLRAERKTEIYRTGTSEQRASYGLVPESISHEGYWDVPRHSYWDDFFVLRGLKDATTITAVLGESALEQEFAAERDDFRRDLYASMRLAMANTGVDYIPGCVELGDFDATSTTVGLDPGGELGMIPEPQLHNTFNKYYAFFTERIQKGYTAYTPYETRLIGSFVLLGQKDRVRALLDFFLNDRRPPAWNHWAEVVWQNRDTPKFIGDMPHTWVGSDFIRSVRNMFVYERERDSALVLGAGLPEDWFRDPAGVSIGAFPTLYGKLDLLIRVEGNTAHAEVGGHLRIPDGRIRLVSPIDRPILRATVNGRNATVSGGDVIIEDFPATVEVFY